LPSFFSGFISLFGGIDQTHKGYDLAKRSELERRERSGCRSIPISEE